jgi:regulatory protein
MEKNHDISSVTERLRALCSRREYCSSDIRRKALTALDNDADSAEKVLNLLIKDKYVDDYRYSCAYARDKASIAGWGPSKIRYMLSSKGVDRDVIDRAMLEIDESKADQRLDRLVRSRYASLRNDPQVRVKLLRYVVGRGYSYDEASSVIDELMKERNDDL